MHTTLPARLDEIKARLTQLYAEQGNATVKIGARQAAQLQAEIKALNRERARIVGIS